MRLEWGRKKTVRETASLLLLLLLTEPLGKPASLLLHYSYDK